MLVLLIGGSTFFFVYFTRSEKQAKVVTTIFPIYDICREILGTEEDVVLIQDNGMDMHSYEPTALDIKTISKSELFIHIGGESDDWVDGIIRSANNVNLKKLSLINTINVLEETDEGILENEHEHDHEDDNEHENAFFDEHIWLSLKNAITMTKEISEALTWVYPERTEIIKINTEKYLNKLIRLESEYANECLNKQKTIVVADRFPFLYLVNDYNLTYLAAFSGCTSETDASAETLTKLIDKVNEENLKYICVLETSNYSLANQIVSSCPDTEVLVLNSCQLISNKDLNNKSYFDIMKSNLEILKKVLN